MNLVDWVNFHDVDRIVEKVKQFYFGDKEINLETIHKFTDVSFGTLLLTTLVKLRNSKIIVKFPLCKGWKNYLVPTVTPLFLIIFYASRKEMGKNNVEVDDSFSNGSNFCYHICSS